MFTEKKEYARSSESSKLAMPRIGCVDDEIEWMNVAICLEVVFEDSFFTISVYTPTDQEQMYPSASPRRITPISAGVDSVFPIATLESGGHILRTISNSGLAYAQRIDRGIGLLLCEMIRHGIRIDGTIEDLVPNPISSEVASRWGCPWRSNSGLNGKTCTGKWCPLSEVEP